MSIVGLHQAPLAHVVMFHPVSDRDDPANDFVPWHHRFAARHITLHAVEQLPIDAADDDALPISSL